MVFKKFIVLFLCVFSFNTFGDLQRAGNGVDPLTNSLSENEREGISGSELLQNLKDTGQLGIFDEPAVSVFEKSCSSMTFASLDNASRTFCEAVVSSEVCQSVEEKDLMDCTQYEESKELSGMEFLRGCGSGAAKSVVEIVRFVWEIVKAIVNPVETYQETSEYFESVKLYIATEYDKAYEEASNPFRRARAASAVAAQSTNIFLKAIQNLISTEYQEFGCLNAQARTEMICKIGSDVLVGIGSGGLVTVKGIKVLKKIKNKNGGGRNSNGRGKDSESAVRTSNGERRNPVERAVRVPENERRNPVERAVRVPESEVRASSGVRVPENTVRTSENTVRVSSGVRVPESTVRTSESTVRVSSGERVPESTVRVSSRERVLNGGRNSEREVRVPESRKRVSSRDSFVTLNKLEMTGDPRVDQFRRALNSDRMAGKNKYISYKNSKNRRVPGKVIGVKDGKVSIKTESGEDLILQGSMLERVRVSDTSKNHFENRNLLDMTGDSRVDHFRRALNSDYIEEKNRYISYINSDNRRVSGRVIDVKDGKVFVQPERGESFILQGNKLENVRVSSKSKNHFQAQQRAERKKLGESSLSKELTPQQVEALEQAHLVGKGQAGKDGTPAGIGNYTEDQIRKKAKILEDADFSLEERRKLMKDGVVGSSDNTASFIRREDGRSISVRNKLGVNLGMTGDSRIDQFRRALNSDRIEGDNIYISYKNSENRRVSGKITDVKDGKVFIKNKSGEDLTLQGSMLERVRLSGTSKAHFENRILLDMTGEPRIDQFRRALNSDRIEGDNIYISYANDDGTARYVGRIFIYNEGQIAVEPFDRRGYKILKGDQLKDVQISHRSKNHFESIDRYEEAYLSNSLLEGDNRYISHYNTDTQIKNFGKVTKVEQGYFYIENEFGKVIKVNPKEPSVIKISEDSKRFFEKRARD